MDSLDDLRDAVRAFVDERDWAQFHTPKNIAMALTVEAAELQEHFQWLTAEQSEALAADQRAAVADELADVQVYLVRLADRLGIDLLEACAAKLEKNRAKYPVELARGRATKYTELGKEEH
jgi:NTP pyrophosphatase (non-canonical NTP hydrolase)